MIRDQSDPPEFTWDNHPHASDQLWEVIDAVVHSARLPSLDGAGTAKQPRTPPRPEVQPAFFRHLGLWLLGLLDDADRARIRAAGQRDRIRVVIHELAQPQHDGLPWEFLYSEDIGGFVALDNRFSIVRYSGEGHRALSPATSSTLGRLFVCPVAVEPRPSRTHLFRSADMYRALKLAVYDRLGKGQCSAEPFVRPSSREEDFTTEDLLGVLQQERPSVLHLMAHGAGSVLLFAGEGGQPLEVDGSCLGGIVSSVPAVRLVNLAVCGSGRVASHRGALAKLAADFSNASRVPWVMGSRATLGTRTASTFFSTMYAELSKGGDVERAVAAGRRELCEAEDWSFGTLALYVHHQEQDRMAFDAAVAPRHSAGTATGAMRGNCWAEWVQNAQRGESRDRALALADAHSALVEFLEQMGELRPAGGSFIAYCEAVAKRNNLRIPKGFQGAVEARNRVVQAGDRRLTAGEAVIAVEAYEQFYLALIDARGEPRPSAKAQSAKGLEPPRSDGVVFGILVGWTALAMIGIVAVCAGFGWVGERLQSMVLSVLR